MKKAPDPRKLFIIAGIASMGGVGLLYTQMQGVGQVQAKVEELRKQSVDQKKVQAELTASQTDLSSLKGRLAHLESGISDSAYIPTLLKDLETIGRSHGIDITAVRPLVDQNAKPDDKKPYDEMKIEFRGRGKYGNVLTFLKSLNGFPKVVGTRTVNLAPATGPNAGPGTKSLDIIIQLTAYIFKDPTKKSDKNQGAA